MVLKGSSRNCANPMTVTSSPMEMSPRRANQPAVTATPTASSELITFENPTYTLWDRVARRVAVSASRLTAR
jgi:hypothetical protein